MIEGTEDGLTVSLDAVTLAWPWIMAAGTVLVLLLIVFGAFGDNPLRRYCNDRIAGPLAKAVRWLGSDVLPVPIVALGALMWLALLAIVFWGLLASIIDLPKHIAAKTDYRTSLITITALTAGLSALVALPFTILRTRHTERQTRATEEGLVTDRINAAVVSLGTEKVVKEPALDKDGNQITSDRGVPEIVERTVPNMEVRIGAIHALGRIARENLEFHVQVMQILCAYIRENAPARLARKLDLPETPPADLEPRAVGKSWREWREKASEKIKEFKARLEPRSDIQTALETLGRRTDEQRRREAAWPDPKGDADNPYDQPFPMAPAYPETYTSDVHAGFAEALVSFMFAATARQQVLQGLKCYRFDLRRTCLQGYDLSDLDLCGAFISGAKLQAAVLWRAKLKGASLANAEMQGADLGSARMQGTDFMFANCHLANIGAAKLQGATLVFAKMQGARLGKTEMQGANLVCAEMQGATYEAAEMMGTLLMGAEMQGADLRGAKLQGAILSDARMQGANLRGVKMDERTNLEAAFLRGAALRLVDYRNVPLSGDQVNEAFGDASVRLPDGLSNDRWPRFALSDTWLSESKTTPFDTEWHAFRKDPDAYNWADRARYYTEDGEFSDLGPPPD